MGRQRRLKAARRQLRAWAKDGVTVRFADQIVSKFGSWRARTVRRLIVVSMSAGAPKVKRDAISNDALR